MITSIFGKSKPINFILCSGILFVYFVIYLFSGDNKLSFSLVSLQIPVLFLLIFSLFMVDFIVKKNELTQKNDYTLFIVSVLIGCFPNIFEHLSIVCIHVFMLLAFRRILSLRSLHSVKQKLFDASLYIAIAMLIDSWIVLFVGIIYFGIVVYVSNDYRNWLVPFIGIATVLLIYLSYIVLTEQSMLTNPLVKFEIKIQYAPENYGRMLLHLFITLLYLVQIVVFLLKIKTFSSQKKSALLVTNVLFFIGIAYVLFAKNNMADSEILLVFPLAVGSANMLENTETKRIVNMIAILLILVSLSFNLYIK